MFYTLMQHTNLAVISAHKIFIPKGGSMRLLNDNNDPSNIKTYLLINQTSPTYTVPNSMPLNWSAIELFKPNDSTYIMDPGATFNIILDENGNSYVQLH